MCCNIDKSNFIAIRMIPGINVITGIVRAYTYNKKKTTIEKKINLNFTAEKVEDIIVKAIAKDLGVTAITPEVAKIAKKNYKKLQMLAICECIPLLNIWAVAKSSLILKEYKKRCKISETFEKNGQVFFSEFDIDKKKFVKYSLGEVFAKGSCGQIRKVVNCSENSIGILKQAILEKGALAIKDVKNEYQQLRFIHSKGKCWGIQAPPKKFIQINEKNTDNTIVTKTGYLGEKYDGDYFDYIMDNERLTFEEYVMDFHQILNGLKQLEQKNILHGDLKPENILVKRDKDGSLLVHLSDFGSAVNASIENDPAKLSGNMGTRPLTANYCPGSDITLSKNFALNGDKNAVIEIEKKRDVFAIGTILYEALEKAYPYTFDSNGCPRTDTPLMVPKTIFLPDGMTKLIEKMLDANYKKRPTATEAFNEFETILKDSCPEIIKEIKTKIQKEYPGSQ